MRREAQVSPVTLRDLHRTAASRRTIGSVYAATGPRLLRMFRRGLKTSPAHVPSVSASSWQETLVPPGGAPVPPECELAKLARRRCIPLRHQERLRTAPLVERDKLGI